MAGTMMSSIHMAAVVGSLPQLQHLSSDKWDPDEWHGAVVGHELWTAVCSLQHLTYLSLNMADVVAFMDKVATRTSQPVVPGVLGLMRAAPDPDKLLLGLRGDAHGELVRDVWW